MRHRLGSFKPRPGSSDFARFHTRPGFAGPLTGALQEMLRLRLSRAPEGPMPDLLEALPARHPDRPWVEEVHARMSSLEARSTELRLLACEHEDGPDGFITIAASAPRVRIEVLPGDWMQVGFAAMREGEGPVRAWPRLLREVCGNGSLVCVDELDERVGAEDLGDAIERAFEPATYAQTVSDLDEARKVRIRDPRTFLDEMQRVLRDRALRNATAERVVAAFEAEGDHSLYGLFNAVTSTARDLPDWRERRDLEEFAGRLARLRRPVPSRRGGAALVPA